MRIQKHERNGSIWFLAKGQVGLMLKSTRKPTVDGGVSHYFGTKHGRGVLRFGPNGG